MHWYFLNLLVKIICRINIYIYNVHIFDFMKTFCLKHTDPNYSCAYVTIKTNGGKFGYGMTFTLGRGTEIVVLACNSIKPLIIGKNAGEIFRNFGAFWRTITSDSQMRWVRIDMFKIIAKLIEK